jgi:alkanesulfonate monooxygenase SsuD/methylene tetrahydromethanopterin reductase-like flavin-dependent oxidoreductase (luciferase family)
LRRAGRLSDGWLGVWVSPERFASSVATVEKEAADAGRPDVKWEHGLLAWCGLNPSRSDARERLSRSMESFYGMPFERFERSSPYGTPEDVADALRPYLEAGATSILLSPIASDTDEALAGVARITELLSAVV